MKAFVLAAGVGSRLAPLTDNNPKALVKFMGKPMIETLLNKLIAFGIREILINVHHHSTKLIHYIKSHEWEGCEVHISDESGELLDTGGAIAKARDFFDGMENILVHNVDIYTEVDFNELEQYHIDSKNLVSLCTRDRASSRNLLFDENNVLIGWRNNKSKEYKWVGSKKEQFTARAYSGVYLASPSYANSLPFDGSFSIIDAWLEMASRYKISEFKDTKAKWFDLGSVDKINDAENSLENDDIDLRFLEKVAKEMLSIQKVEMVNTIAILPNKRSVVFLKRYFIKLKDKPLWLPNFMSIDEYMESISGFSKAEPLNLFFDLLSIHQQTNKDESKNIENFLSWAPMIIKDFNDIDLYLASAEEVLKHITEARAIKEWNLDKTELSNLQKSYIDFYQSLFVYYEELKKVMIEKHYAYSGFIYRYNAENIKSLIENTKWTNYLLVGFNALSPSEESVFSFIIDNFKNSIYLDGDKYYLESTKHGLARQEAGEHLNKLLKTWKLENFNWLTDRLMNQPKIINLHQVKGKTAQSKLCGDLVKNQLLNSSNDDKSLINDTAIVLADEDLLIPVLSSLPSEHNEESIKYNVTLGYSLNNSPLKGLLFDWFEIINSIKLNENKLMRTQSIINLFLNNILVSKSNSKQLEFYRSLSTYFINHNIALISYEDLCELVEGDNESIKEMLDILFSDKQDVNEILLSVFNLLMLLKEVEEKPNAGDDLLNQQLLIVLKICKRLISSSYSQIKDLDVKSFSSIFFQLLSNYQLSLKGEPLNGIQIMGMLETRSLDFKNIILLSANEGILPKSALSDSFIPFDIRHAYGLPLPKDKNSVIAYHFFRLLQYAKNVDIIYDTASEGIGVGEASRFIRQIELELAKNNTNIELNKYQLNQQNTVGDSSISINKNETLDKLLKAKLEKGLSPSALNTYILCKLKFFFQYILKLNKEKEIEASVESNTFGSIIHDTLEELFEEFIEKEIDANVLNKALKTVSDILNKYYHKHYNKHFLKQGKNLLIWEVSKKYVENFIKYEIRNLENSPKTIVSLEEEINLEFNIEGVIVNLTGIIDRIDKLSDSSILRIADYKTGSVSTNDLSLRNFDKFGNDPKYSKAMQLLFYAFIYFNTHKSVDADRLKVGIFSLRNLSDGFIELKPKQGWEEIMSEFEKILKGIISEMTDPNTPYEQTKEQDNCKYCDFKSICNKH